MERLQEYIGKRSVWESWHLEERRDPFSGRTFTAKLKRPAADSFARLVRVSGPPIPPMKTDSDDIETRQQYLADQNYMFWVDVQLFGRPGKPVVRLTLMPEDLATETALFSEKSGPWGVGDALGRLVMKKLRAEHGVEENYLAIL
ncbi:hypothetical protein [Rhodospira trueperi]|nr:hypothetical protein [Rhodospira trueperi]